MGLDFLFIIFVGNQGFEVVKQKEHIFCVIEPVFRCNNETGQVSTQETTPYN